ncbi:MAG: hypothetical protein DCF15_19300, partial [Phormidesmis priestleyi]
MWQDISQVSGWDTRNVPAQICSTLKFFLLVNRFFLTFITVTIMSIRQILQVWEHELSHPHQSIMLALADHAREDGTGIRPSIKRIAWKTGYSERSVQNIMSQLRDLGLLVIVVPATHNTPNEYKFDWSAVTPKPSFDEYMDVKKGRKGRGEQSAPLLNPSDRGAVPVQEGCSSRAIGVQIPCNRGAVPVQEGCSP